MSRLGEGLPVDSSSLASAIESDFSEYRNSMNSTIFQNSFLSLLLSAAAVYADPPEGDPPDHLFDSPVRIEQALRLAYQNDPRFQLLAERRNGVEGQIEQAGSRPNPVLAAEAENFLGTGPISGVKGLELTLGVSQIIETAGKRDLRVAIEHQNRTVLDWQIQQARAELEADVYRVFAATLLAEETVALRREELELAEQGYEVSKELVEKASASRAEEVRTQLSVRLQQFALDQAMRELDAARGDLAAYLGMDPSVALAVEGDPVLDGQVPSWSTLVEALESSVRLRGFEVESERRKAVVALEEAMGTPDWEVFGGARYFNEEDGNMGFVASVAVPLPFLDQNRGNIRTARSALRSVEFERETERRRMLVQLQRAWQSLRSAAADVSSIDNELIPAANLALREVEELYRRGRLNQVAVLNSRKELFGLREARIDGVRRYLDARQSIRDILLPVSVK